MDERLEQEIKAFEDIESYAELMDRPYTRALKEETYRRMKKFDFRDKRILEVGAGITEFGELYKGSELVCLSDLSFKLLKENRYENGVQVVCDGQRLPFKDKSLDYVIFIGVLHHFPDQEKGLSEGLRVMKNGGKSFMVEPHRLSINYIFYIGRILFLKLFGAEYVKKMIGCFTPEEVQLDTKAVKRVFSGGTKVRKETILSFRLPPFRIFRNSSFDVKLSRLLDRIFPFSKMGTTIFVEVEKKG